ncbi:MAG TPA: hypothetical protein VG371_18475 [Solirubrobacteraceae bacterium]|nr:hypothetical protein [Solirubrobacteraceae bacterium]
MRDSAGIKPDFAALSATPDRPARAGSYQSVGRRAGVRGRDSARQGAHNYESVALERSSPYVVVSMIRRAGYCVSIVINGGLLEAAGS